MGFLLLLLGAGDVGLLGCLRGRTLARMLDGHDGLMGTHEAPRAGRARMEVVGPCRLAVAIANAREECDAGLMGIFSFDERMVDLVPIGGGQGG